MKTVDHLGSMFLRQILRRMKQLGLNQSELAQRMKVSKPYITKVLRQDVNISFRTAAKLARAVKMDFFPTLKEQEGFNAKSANGATEISAPARRCAAGAELISVAASGE